MGRHISLFAGLGGDFLGSRNLGFTPVASAEIDPWLRRLLNLRFPTALDLGDVRKVQGAGRRSVFGGKGTLLSGGFPCQDLSAPGYGDGLRGKRSGLYRELMRLVGELSPEYVVIENVAVLRNKGLHTLLSELHWLGYDALWNCVPAAFVGAPHRRDRIWITAKKQLTPDDLHNHVRRVSAIERLGTINLTNRVHTGRFGEPDHIKFLSRFPRAGSMVQGEVYERRAIKNPPPKSGLWPTPTFSDGTGGPGVSPHRTGGKNLRTAAGGSLNPEWVEYMMGVPRGWTDLDKATAELVPFRGWVADHYPRTVTGRMKDRGKRVSALGNALVPQVFEHVLNDIIQW